jgi:tetratricopeptide (TPR) repeat protein
MRKRWLLLLAPALIAAGQALNSPSLDELVRAGADAQQRGDFPAAVDHFRKALAMQPDNLDARLNLGVALASEGQLDAAIEEDRQILAVVPNHTGARKNLVLAYYTKGDLARARMEAEGLHAAMPGDVPVAVLLANTYIKMGRESQAVELLLPLEPGHESDMDLEYSLAFAEIQSGQAVDGVARMEKVARATRSANAWVIAGATRLHRAEIAEAKTDLDAAIELNPSLPGLQTMAGQVQYALGNEDAELPFFQAALRADPRDFTANLYTGMYWLKKGDFGSARPLLELALELQPQSPLARLKMAELTGMEGNYDQAVKTLEELEKADPEWSDPHIQLAALYYKLHRPEDGQRERSIVQEMEERTQKQGPPRK